MMFPIYRKAVNEKSYYKINAFDEFEEIQRIGNSYSIHHMKAEIYPDKLLIQDMIGITSAFWMECSENDYTIFLNYCKLNLTSLNK